MGASLAVRISFAILYIFERNALLLERFEDSRARVISLIQAMKEKLGDGFPSSNNMVIPNAWIVLADDSQDSAAN